MRQGAVWLRRSGTLRVASAVNEAVAIGKDCVWSYLEATSSEETNGLGSFALKYEASDVVRLAGGADEVIDLAHQELQRLRRCPGRQIMDRVEPAPISKF